MKRPLEAIIGLCGVNIAEPCPGDLSRVHAEYRVLWKLLKELKTKFCWCDDNIQCTFCDILNSKHQSNGGMEGGG
jgi:hypothetical protein